MGLTGLGILSNCIRGEGCRFFATILFLLLSCFVPTAFSQNDLQGKEKLHPKLSSILSTLEEKHGEKAEIAPQFASERGIKLENDNKIEVFIIFDKEKPLNREALEGYGAEIIKGTDDVIKAKIPIGMLRTIADNVEGILFIDLPNKPHGSISSQGVGLIGSSFYQTIGYTGAGVKVAIIDSGFEGLNSTIDAGELPGDVIKLDCTGSSCVSSTFQFETNPHGTRVAQIVHDVAPGAKLYLIKIYDNLDLVDAKNHCINNGIAIFNLSMTWHNTNKYDGQCYFSNPVCTANDANERGILWVNSAGNYAQMHYQAIFTDNDLDGWHNVSSEGETITFSATAGDKISLHLTWNGWPNTDQDYDLYLYFRGTSGLSLVESSRTLQTGTQKPTEEIIIDAPSTGTYAVSIMKSRASSNHFLELYSRNHNLTPTVVSSSLGSPADASSVLSVAAINSNNWQTGPQEAFSSQGPTNDGRIKPDISGPDYVATYYPGYVSYSFGGTSAAAPHVAGLAAQIKQARPDWQANQIRYYLESNAIDLGVAGKDNIYGLGLVQFPRPIFNDVLLSYWAHDYIIGIFNAQITTGCSQTPLLFCPDQLINREQMATFIVRAVENDPPNNYCDS